MKLLPALLLLLAGSAFAAEPLVLKLWPNGAPEKPGVKIEPEKTIVKEPSDGVVRLTNVSDPMITVYKPEKPNGTSVLVCPGGG